MFGAPADYLGAEPISTTALGWRLADKEPEPGKRPPGEINNLAARLRDEWQRAGLVTVESGPRNSKMISLKAEDRA